MMMQCPRCSTRWRVAAASPVLNPLFKCGRCHHLFRQFPGAAPVTEPAPSEARRAAAPEPDTLEFIFPERQPAALLLSEDTPVTAAAASSESTVLVEAPSPAINEPDETTFLASAPPERSDAETERLVDDFSFGDEATEARLELGQPQFPDEALGEPAPAIEMRTQPAGSAAFTDAEPPAAADTIDEEHDDEDADDVDALSDDEDEEAETYASVSRTLHLEDTVKAPAGFATIARTLGTIVAGFAVLALVVRVAPERMSGWLARLPLAGASFATDRNLTRKIELRNVQGKYQRLRNTRRVFVISGEARNNSPVTLERIEVAGILYGGGGDELDQRVVTTGNRTTLTDLSEAEIVLLQNLDPALALAPGETTPFLIVFLEPPRELREFSSRVLSVRPTRQASTPPRQVGSPRDRVG